jgi:hypothetical protein
VRITTQYRYFEDGASVQLLDNIRIQKHLRITDQETLDTNHEFSCIYKYPIMYFTKIRR